MKTNTPTRKTRPAQTGPVLLTCSAIDAPVLPADAGALQGFHAHDLGLATATLCRGRLTARAIAREVA